MDALASTNHVTLIESPIFGLTAVAATNITAGDVVLHESAALTIRQRRHRNEDEEENISTHLQAALHLSLEHGLEPSYFDAIAEIEERNLSDVEIGRLCSGIYSPMLYEPKAQNPKHLQQQSKKKRGQQHQDPSSNTGGDDDAQTTTSWSSTILQPSQEELSAGRAFLTSDNAKHVAIFLTLERRAMWQRLMRNDAKEVVRFLHGVRVNTHSDEKKQICGVYLLASKLAHSCAPNTFWFVTRNDSDAQSQDKDEHLPPTMGSVKHVATRNISKGEVLSFSYIGTGWNLLTHTLQRRQMLHHLNFVCRCDRCAQYDNGTESCRLLVCSTCVHQARAQASGKNAKLLRLCDAATVQLSKKNGWRCMTCSSVPGLEEIGDALFAERCLFDEVLGAFFVRKPHRSVVQSTSLASVGSVFLRPLYARYTPLARILETLGPKHYSFVAGVCGFFRLLIFNLAAVVGGADCPPPIHSEQAIDDDDDGETEEENSCSGFRVKELSQLLMGACIWFERNMRGVPQHVRFAGHALELTQLLIALSDDNDGDRDAESTPHQRECREALGLSDDRDSLGIMMKVCEAKCRPIAGPLMLRYDEYAPLTKEGKLLCEAPMPE